MMQINCWKYVRRDKTTRFDTKKSSIGRVVMAFRARYRETGVKFIPGGRFPASNATMADVAARCRSLGDWNGLFGREIVRSIVRNTLVVDSSMTI